MSDRRLLSLAGWGLLALGLWLVFGYVGLVLAVGGLLVAAGLQAADG